MSSASRIKQIGAFGQSIWLDFLSRSLLESGMLKHLIEEDGISGVTTNPAIFEKAVTEGTAYDKAIRTLADRDRDAAEICRVLVLEDVAAAADLLYPVYEATRGRDGYVSIEVSPHLASDVAGTIAEAHGLWGTLNRPNVLIKVPATIPGLQAIRQLLTDGINVNVTLLFGLDRYRDVTEAWLSGLEAHIASGNTIRHPPVSVASLFLSRIDTLVDSMLAERSRESVPDEAGAPQLEGEAALATARLAYREYQAVVSSDRFRTLANHGARPQHLLWASTGTKNPLYADTRYVEPLIGPETINTLPMDTLDAYRDHGQPAMRLTKDPERAEALMSILQEHGIDMKAVAQQLEDEGVQKFMTAQDQLLKTIEKKCIEVNRNENRYSTANLRK